MGCLFKVNGKNKFDNNKKMTVSVYGVRTPEDNPYKAEFLVYYNGQWVWMEAENYTPLDNVHG